MPPHDTVGRTRARPAGATTWLFLLLLFSSCSPPPPPPAAPSAPIGPAEAVYDTDVRFDLEAATIQVRSSLRFVADASTADSFVIRLGPLLQLHELRGRGIRSHRTEAREFRNETVVQTDGSVRPGSEVWVEVEYGGRPSFWESRINEITPDWVQLSIDGGWHPELAHTRSVTGTLRIHLPAEWQVVGSGSVLVEKGVFVMSNTVPQVDVSFSAGPRLERVATPSSTIYFRDERSGDVPLLAESAEACASYLNAHFGSRDSLPHVRFVLSPNSSATFARKNFIPLSSLGGADEVGVYRFVCHELAHFWATPDITSPRDGWMSEAFAEFVAGRALRERYGQETFDRWVARRGERGRGHGPIWTPDLTSRVPDGAMYDRAPYLLSRLEERIGTERLDRFVRRYMTDRIQSTGELLQALAEIAGDGTAAWFEQELRREDES